MCICTVLQPCRHGAQGRALDACILRSFIHACPAPAHCWRRIVPVAVLTSATLYPCPSFGHATPAASTFLLGETAGASWLHLCHLQDSGVRAGVCSPLHAAPHGPIPLLGHSKFGPRLCTPVPPTLTPSSSVCIGLLPAHTTASAGVGSPLLPPLYSTIPPQTVAPALVVGQ